MFQGITWSTYFLTLLVILVVYYVWLWIFIYGAPLPVAFRGLVNSRDISGEENPEVKKSGLSPYVYHLLKPCFVYTYTKNELILSLQKKIQSLPEKNDMLFRESLERFILSESLAKCSIRLDEEDIRAVWLT